MAPRRGVRLVLSLIGLAVVVSMAAVVLMFVAVSRGPSVPSSATLVLRPGGDLPEVEPDDVVGQVFGRDVNTVRGFVEALRRASRDDRVRAVLLMPSTLDLPYWGKVQEMRDAVVAFRKSGKKVTAFLEFGGDREYYLASAADRVFLMPTSSLDLTGVASYEMFLRGTLDKIGAYADFVHIGDYKTAPNQLTQKGFTPAHREMSRSLNRDMYDQLVAGIAEGRKKNENEIRDLLDKGPFVAKDALDAGLVDELAYEDELDDRVPELGDGDTMRRVEGDDYQRIRPQSVGIRPRSRIALLYVVGTIVSGKSGFDAVNGSVVGSETIIDQIRKIRDDDSIKAIVLRIDSPGGSSVASDVIWRELTITREENPKRPIVTSMSDLAASGGYYIAMPTEAIVAQPGTLTGSIGIFGGKIVIGGTLAKVGVTTESVISGANADIYSPFAPFTPAQRAKLASFMDDFYKNFLKKVADSRKSTPDAIHAVAQGRVWTGRQALGHGLVDALGGLDAAVALAKEKAKIPANEEVQLVVYPERRSLFDVVSEQFGGAGTAGLWSMLAGTSERRAMAALSAPTRLFRRGEPLALMPFTFVR
ncbi:MAG TPA: signal peptide peptidase SppA [Vicinamibacterales bacterium]|nr:signal peptide peptidase SppA [Vicinamibacterales bacterium]